MIRTLLFFSIILTLISCTPKNPPPQKSPDISLSTSPPEQVDQSQSSIIQLESLPFDLTIGDQKVKSDLKVSVPESKGITIQFLSQIPTSGQMKIIDSKNKTMLLGAWQSNSAQFYYAFPYGENHLIITLKSKEYDVLVIAGAPAHASSAPTGPGYINLTANVTWNYEESRKNEYLQYWTYRVQDWAQDPSGPIRLTITTEGSTGVEKKVNRVAQLYLVCRDGTIFITRATETEGETHSNTTYDENTVYLPAILTEGQWWQRQGILEITKDGAVSTYNITEKFTCLGKEKVSVRSGEFEADKVDYLIIRSKGGEEQRYKGTTWYVPGLGRVLSIGTQADAPRMELVSFENIKAF
jgi:hypothetical protein